MHMRRRTMPSSYWGFDPLTDIMRLHRSIDDMFGGLVTQPVCDLEETDNSYLVTVDLPGVPKENVKLELRDKQLYLSGDRKVSSKKEQEYSHFETFIDLPGNVDANKVEASCE